MAGDNTYDKIKLKKLDGTAVVPLINDATNNEKGIVKPDGTTITVNNGVLSASGTSITVDSAISSTSENPVQNKIIKSALDGKANSTHTHTKSQITDFPTIPSKTSDLTNDSGFLTSHQDISGKADVDHTHTSTDITDLSSTISSAISGKADSATSLSGYGITDAYTKTEIDGMISAGMHYKGTKASYSALPSTGNTIGDLWNVTDTGANYAWNGSAWDKLSENIDLSGYVTTSRTINGKALTGSISLTASDVGALPDDTVIPTVPTNVSAFTNDAGYITSYTDTKNTTGTTNKTGTKMYLAGATTQGANPQTYSNSNCYIGTDNCLYSGGVKVLTAHQSLSGYVTTSTTVNGKALSTNISLTASDVGALPSSTSIPTKLSDLTDDLGSSPTHTHSQYLTSVTAHNQSSNTITTLTGYTKGTTSGALATNDTLNSALSKIENNLDSKQSTTTAVTHTASTAVGSSTNPVYISNTGVATACGHTLEADVPSDAVFTDTVYTHPTTAGYKHIPSGGSTGQILKYSASGTATWANEYSYTHPTSAGNKHVPTGGSANQVLVYGGSSGTASWGAVPSHTHSEYASSTHSHVGSEVTLTGYTVASSVSAVAATDTVNVAFGKLQKAINDLDSNFQALVTTLNNAS